jgi:hypothetical protein
MADNMQLPPSGGPAGYSAATVPPGPQLRGAVLVAVLLIAVGAILGLLGGLIWAAASPQVVYQVATLSPPTAYAINPETSAFIAADGIFTFIALGGGALLGVVGYLFGVRRYGLLPMIGLIGGAVAAAYIAKWLGPELTGQQTFNAKLASSKPGQFLRAPITLGAHGALAFWPVAAALVAGVLELLSFMRARRIAVAALSQTVGQPYGMPGPPFGTAGQSYAASGQPYSAPGQPYSAPGQPYSAPGQPAGALPPFSPPPPPPPSAASAPQQPAEPAGKPPQWPGGQTSPAPGQYGWPDGDRQGPDQSAG